MPEHDHEGHRNRLREKFWKSRLDGFEPHEALELLLFYAIPRRNVNDLAHRLIDTFGSLEAVLSAPPAMLTQVEGVGQNAAVLIAMVAPLVRRAALDKQGKKPVVTNYQQAKAFCVTLFDAIWDERFYVVCLDAQGRVLRAVHAFTGTIDETPVYPRTIVSIALSHNAHSVLLAHNHPSGVLEPSDGDLRTTELLRDALATVDIQILDHVIVAGGEALSIAQWEQRQRVTPLPAPEYRAADTKRPRRRGVETVNEGEHEEEPNR